MVSALSTLPWCLSLGVLAKPEPYLSPLLSSEGALPE